MQRYIFRFWASLAGTLTMMAVEMTILTACVARLPDPKVNLAALGISVAVSIFCEAPILRLLSAAIAFIKDRPSLDAFRSFAYGHSIFFSLLFLAISATPAYFFLAGSVLGLPEEVIDHLRIPLLLFFPSPFFVGYRRVHQGILIGAGQPKKVTICTAVRLLVLTGTAVLLPYFVELRGATLGAMASSLGMVAEALMARLFSGAILRELREQDGSGTQPSFTVIAKFYYPLAVSSTVLLFAPMLESFFLARGQNSLSSLALLPVLNGILNPFSWAAFAMQDTYLAISKEGVDHARELRRFAQILSAVIGGAFCFFTLGGIAPLWFHRVSGIDPELIPLAVHAAVYLTPIPALGVFKAYQRGRMIEAHQTGAVLVIEFFDVLFFAGFLFYGIIVAGSTGLIVVAVGYSLSAIVNVILGRAFLLRSEKLKLRTETV